MKSLHSYIKQIEGKIPSFNPQAPEGCSTSSYWREDGDVRNVKPSESVTATFEEVDERAEAMGLTAWRNNH